MDKPYACQWVSIGEKTIHGQFIYGPVAECEAAVQEAMKARRPGVKAHDCRGSRTLHATLNAARRAANSETNAYRWTWGYYTDASPASDYRAELAPLLEPQS